MPAAVNWPHIQGAAPPDLVAVAAIARALAAELQGVSLREAERRSGVSRSTISRILNGQTWPTVREIARLEQALDCHLLGTRG